MKKIDQSLLDQTIRRGQSTARKRMNYNFHEFPDDPLQRLLNAIEPGSYIQPHKHEDPDKREVFFVLKGKMAVIEFDESGNITDHIILDPLSGGYAAEIPARTFHTVISLESGSVAYEVKDGPYNPIDDKNFASWAPKEGTDETMLFQQRWLREIGL